MPSTTLPTYTWQEARKAFLERNERTFIVSPRYPLHPKLSLNPCGPMCCTSVIVDFRESGYLMIRCEFCKAETNGGKFHIGITDTPTKSKRLFGDIQRRNIMLRDGVRCFMCGCGPDKDELEADHIVPFSKGGPSDELNGITLCRSCNQAKTDQIDQDFIQRALMWTHKVEGQKLFFRVKAVACSLVAWGVKDIV